MKKVQIGARVSQEDAEFISKLKIEGAHTPSDKLRAIIESARKKSEYAYDYSGCYRSYKSELNPIVETIKAMEHEQGMHSAILDRIFEWMPDFYAYCLTSLNKENKNDSLIEYEKGATERIFRLFESLLHVELSKQKVSYTPHLTRNFFETLEYFIQIVNKPSHSNEG